jgi:mannose-6-phosphate isomerase-like protein (cupin superfamily)
MAHTGQIITNPVSGETIAFRQISDELLAFDLLLTPDGHVPGMHVHPQQTERFEVIEGRMKFRLGRKTIEAGPGEVVTVPAGAAHKFANAGDHPVRARVEVRPALKMAELLETTVRLAEDGRTTRKGMPKPTALALFTTEFRREVRAPFPPAWMVRALMSPLAALARARGTTSATRWPSS